jgi:hypothetical protein
MNLSIIISTTLSTLLFLTLNSVHASIVVAEAKETPESEWGRVYLKNGIAPIQYFRDTFGGPMINREVEFYFPRQQEDQMGCSPLPEEEQQYIKSKNGSIALVLDRGECTFLTKALTAQDMGAGAVVIVSTAENSERPKAIIEEEDIKIPSIMIRKTGGDLLRDVATRLPAVYGRLIPITCQRSPYICYARTNEEEDYMEATVRSGLLTSMDENAVGEFLAATYGSIFPSDSIEVTTSGALPANFCGPIENEATIKYKIAMIPHGGCSILQKVSNAQLAGAHAAIVTLPSDASFDHLTVENKWEAYNITIPVASISSATADVITRSNTDKLRFKPRNDIAIEWDTIRRLNDITFWPKRKSRRVNFIRDFVEKNAEHDDRRGNLKRQFLQIAGGSSDEWEFIEESVLANLAVTVSHEEL